MEEYTVTEWTGSDGISTSKVTDEIPVGMDTGSNAVVLTEDAKGKPLKKRKENSNYSSSLSGSYTSREDRAEWVVVGLLGQIPITKGQPTASSWIKMQDVSDTVESWLVK